MGYSDQYKGYRCLYPPTGKVYISRHTIFDEECFPFKDQYKHLVPLYETPLLKAWQAATSPPVHVQEEQITRFLSTPHQTQEAPDIVQQEVHNDDQGNQSDHSEAGDLDAVLPPAPPVVVPNSHPMQTRAKAGVHKPNTRYALLAPKSSGSLPKNITEAMKHPEWNNAVMTEMGNIHLLDTWSLVPQTEDMNVVTSRWIYTEKTKSRWYREEKKSQTGGKRISTRRRGGLSRDLQSCSQNINNSSDAYDCYCQRLAHKTT